MSLPIGIIGGSGLYSIENLELIKEHSLTTPFGAPSDSILEARLGQVAVFFLPRHGKGHRLLPSEVNNRANIYALRELGVGWCIGVSASGSLAQEIAPGDFVVPDQIIDKTFLRQSTFFGNGVVAHVSMAQPYCPVLCKLLVKQANQIGKSKGFKVHPAGTYLCMEGPAFSTKAESELHRAWGAKVIGMTAAPEAKLAREAQIAYATLAIATDYDCWKEDEGHVDVSAVVATLTRSVANAKEILAGVIPELANSTPSTIASAALKNAVMSDPKNAPNETMAKLRAILG